MVFLCLAGEEVPRLDLDRHSQSRLIDHRSVHIQRHQSQADRCFLVDPHELLAVTLSDELDDYNRDARMGICVKGDAMYFSADWTGILCCWCGKHSPDLKHQN